jgi:hypothetical protein
METMTDIWRTLEGKDRAKCWKIFKKLCYALIYEKKGVLAEHTSELRELAADFNAVSGTGHFDLLSDDETFFSALIDELEEIKKRSFIAD